MTGLHTQGLTIRFGGLTAVDKIDLSLEPGEIVGIIGPNGAGKTTLINLLAGIYTPTAGRVIFNGEDITAVPAHIRAVLGIARTFQLIKPLEHLNLIENVMTGLLFAGKRSLREARRAAGELCTSLGLEDLGRPTERLTVLEIKKMEIAKALAVEPSMLFLDEVMAGLNSAETLEIIAMIHTIAAERNLGVGVVEHVMGVIKTLTRRVVVLDGGGVIATGPYETVARDPRVVAAYLGASV